MPFNRRLSTQRQVTCVGCDISFRRGELTADKPLLLSVLRKYKKPGDNQLRFRLNYKSSVLFSALISAGLSLYETENTPAQSANMVKMYVGRITKIGDQDFKTLSLSSEVVESKCISRGESRTVSSGYVINWVNTFDAQKKGDGVLCTNGAYRVEGQDGQLWTGAMSYNVYMENGTVWEIDRPQ